MNKKIELPDHIADKLSNAGSHIKKVKEKEAYRMDLISKRDALFIEYNIINKEIGTIDTELRAEKHQDLDSISRDLLEEVISQLTKIEK